MYGYSPTQKSDAYPYRVLVDGQAIATPDDAAITPKGRGQDRVEVTDKIICNRMEALYRI